MGEEASVRLYAPGKFVTVKRWSANINMLMNLIRERVITVQCFIENKPVSPRSWGACTQKVTDSTWEPCACVCLCWSCQSTGSCHFNPVIHVPPHCYCCFEEDMWGSIVSCKLYMWGQTGLCEWGICSCHDCTHLLGSFLWHAIHLSDHVLIELIHTEALRWYTGQQL